MQSEYQILPKSKFLTLLLGKTHMHSNPKIKKRMNSLETNSTYA